MNLIKEESAEFFAPLNEKVSKELEVFYNPKMKLNRDITILLLNSIEKNNLVVADILAGSGIRSIRMLKELSKDKIKKILINDYDEESVKLIKKNLEINKLNYIKKISIDTKELAKDIFISIKNEEASKLLLNETGFDYIDIDPFGSPNQFLDAAIKRLSREGILAVTATDTAALSGSQPNAGARKYHAKTKNNYLMHETGIRILARKVQLIGAQYERALVPIFSYAKEHYYRIFFISKKGKKIVDKLIKEHKYVMFCNICMNFNVSSKNCGTCCEKEMEEIGPMWCGDLWDEDLVRTIKNNLTNNPDDDLQNKVLPKIGAGGRGSVGGFKLDKELINLLSTISDEAKIKTVGFFDLHEICERQKISVPKFEAVKLKLEEKGFKVFKTHFSAHSIKTDAKFEEVLLLLIKK